MQGSRKGHPFLPGHHLQSEVLQSPEYQKDSLVFWLPQEPFAPQARDNSARDLWKLQSPKSTTWLRWAGGFIYDIRYINSKEQSDPHIRLMSSRLGLGDWDKRKFVSPISYQKSTSQTIKCCHAHIANRRIFRRRVAGRGLEIATSKLHVWQVLRHMTCIEGQPPHNKPLTTSAGKWLTSRV